MLNSFLEDLHRIAELIKKKKIPRRPACIAVQAGKASE